jgi:Tfp pilus assembly protein PilZ/CheY-like chemotaxis protein
VTHQRAVLVDRDPLLLSRLTGELSRSGFVVETLASVVGLTPDLLALSHPDFLLLDSELPGMKHAAMIVLIRSLKAQRPVRVVVSTGEDPSWIRAHLQPDQVVRRPQLLEEGARALGISLKPEARVDVRAIIDEVLGQRCAGQVQLLEVKIDLFSKGNFYVGKDNGLGVFIPTSVLLPVGHKVEIHLELMGQPKMVLSGEVAWQRSYSSFGGRVSSGIGIKPLDIPATHRKAIDHFVQTRQPLTWSA